MDYSLLAASLSSTFDCTFIVFHGKQINSAA